MQLCVTKKNGNRRRSLLRPLDFLHSCFVGENFIVSGPGDSPVASPHATRQNLSENLSVLLRWRLRSRPAVKTIPVASLAAVVRLSCFVSGEQEQVGISN